VWQAVLPELAAQSVPVLALVVAGVVEAAVRRRVSPERVQPRPSSRASAVR